MAVPPFMHPFVLDVAPVERQRLGIIDVHADRLDAAAPRPAVVFVHGGPVPPEAHPRPRDWPTFLGYGALAAAYGLAGVTVEHRLHRVADYPAAAQDVASAVEQARGVPGVDPDRVALWFFSGGGPLATRWLAAPPPWLRCIALTYPLLVPPPGWADGAADGSAGTVAEPPAAARLPILLTRVGREYPEAARTQDVFLAAARAARVAVDLIEVPGGQHSFDNLDHTDESRAAVTQAMTWVSGRLAGGEASSASGSSS
ncbi:MULTISPECIES: alpha/beta hydrolase [Pseudofrankia]|uniref:alpha/beta hydrolase n=1 Tax=Pseudofrankia TaxID=2994363 RepID=UPI000234C5A9|nr:MULTISPECIES: hypothetical protein [Pseudofrankia]OHV37113.1 hypothetical protein BCD49_18200 [Pseudofrankia sp. EUN1h]